MMNDEEKRELRIGPKLQIQWEQKCLHRILDVVARFPKGMRFVLSNRIADLSVQIACSIHRTRYLKHGSTQIQHLEDINQHISMVGMLLRISHDRKLLSTGALEEISREMEVAGNMLGGWKKSCLMK